MTSKKKDNILLAIEAMSKSQNNDPKIADLVFKAFSTVSLALIMWVLTAVNAMQQDYVSNNVKQELIIGTIDKIQKKVDDFTSKPRFTEPDFNYRIVPLTNAVNLNSSEISVIKASNQNMQKKLSKLELEFHIVKNNSNNRN